MTVLRAWLTPDDPPDGTVCIKLTIPGGDEYGAIVRGAIAPLFNPANFEQYGAQTPEETAQAFVDALALFQWEQCDNVANPVGQVFAWAGATLPTGALACDGSQVSQSTYADLYAVIGNTWGSADAGYFRLPDLRSRMLVGTGQGSGLSNYALADVGGEEEHQLSQQEMPSHGHLFTLNTIANTTTTGAVQRWRDSSGGTPVEMSTQGKGEDLPHENRPPYAAVTWAIWALA